MVRGMMVVGTRFVASIPSTRSPPEVLAKDEASGQKFRVVGMTISVGRTHVVDGTAFGGPGGDESLKSWFVDLIERNVQKGHKISLGHGEALIKDPTRDKSNAPGKPLFMCTCLGTE